MHQTQNWELHRDVKTKTGASHVAGSDLCRELPAQLPWSSLLTQGWLEHLHLTQASGARFLHYL